MQHVRAAFYRGKQQDTETVADMEGYLGLSAAKGDNVQEGSSREVAPAMHVVLLPRQHGSLLPNKCDRIAN